MWSLWQVAIAASLLLPALWLLASTFQNLSLPLIVLGIALVVYFLGELLHGMNLNFQLFGANTTSSLTMTVEAAELEMLKLELRELKENLLGSAEISGKKLANALSVLRNFSQMDAKVQEVRDVLRMLERDQSGTWEEMLQRQQQSGRELADFAVNQLAERVMHKDFWERLGPHLLAAGLVQHLDAETQLRLETEKARAQEQLRIDHGIPQSLEKIRVAGQIEHSLAMSREFDTALPYRAAVLLAVCAGICGLALLYHFMKRRLAVPPLLDASTSWRWVWPVRATVDQVFAGDMDKPDKPKVVLEEDVLQTVKDMALTARGRHGLALPNAVFFGPPGTGKTLTAQRLAEACGMDYAMLSGGNVLGLKEEAVPELRRVFRWAKRSFSGLLLFIDEAEAFLCCRGSQDNAHVRAALSFFLAQTGASSPHLLLILATNRVKDLDAAVLSRLVFHIEFKAPDEHLLQQQVEDRLQRLDPPARQRLSELLKRGGASYAALRTSNFSGRDVQSLFEDFARRWRLEQDFGRKADAAWLERWLQHRLTDQ